MSHVKVDSNRYATNYNLAQRANVHDAKKHLGFDSMAEMDRTFDLIKYSLIQHKIESNNATILNIGPGPAVMAQDFVAAFVPYCEKIVLCEVNPSFCRDYKLSQWYKINEHKIEIINKPFEQLYNNDNNETKFDLIWCSHVLYHMRLKYIPKFIEKLANLLNGKNCYGIVAIAEDESNYIKYTKRLVREKFGLSRYFEQCLDDSSFINWYMLRFHSDIPLNSEQDAIDVLKLLLTEDLLHHPDYNESLKINQQDKKNLEKTVEIALKKTFTGDITLKSITF